MLLFGVRAKSRVKSEAFLYVSKVTTWLYHDQFATCHIAKVQCCYTKHLQNLRFPSNTYFLFLKRVLGGVDEQFASGSVMMRTELMERAAFLRIYKRVDLHFAADCTAEEILVGFCLDIYLLSKISSGGC